MRISLYILLLSIHYANAADLGSRDFQLGLAPITRVNPNLVELDKVEAVVNGAPITSKFIARLGFYGEEYTLDKLIDSYLANQLGDRLKINVSDDDIDRYIQGLGMTPADVDHLGLQWGYPSTNELKSDLKIMYRGMGATKYEIDSRLIITEPEIAAYYQAHPIETEAKYLVRTAYVARDGHEIAEQQRMLEQQAAKHRGQPERAKWDWEPVVEILDSEISVTNGFLRKLQVGDIFLKFVGNGFDIFTLQKIIPAGVMSLESRRNEIVRELQGSKHQTVITAVKQDLRVQADIVYPISA